MQGTTGNTVAPRAAIGAIVLRDMKVVAAEQREFVNKAGELVQFGKVSFEVPSSKPGRLYEVFELNAVYEGVPAIERAMAARKPITLEAEMVARRAGKDEYVTLRVVRVVGGPS
jgi:hypothetical protein